MVRLFDNTLRDGGNVVGHGFPISLTQSIIGALLEAGIPDIECGNCKGLGAYAKADAKQAPSDEEYFEAVQPYLSRGRIGMFMLAKLAGRGGRAVKEHIDARYQKKISEEYYKKHSDEKP